jgi:hypothetical protein
VTPGGLVRRHGPWGGGVPFVSGRLAGSWRSCGFIGQEEHPQLHRAGTGRGVFGAVTVGVEQRHVSLEHGLQVGQGVVAGRPRQAGPVAVLAALVQQPAEQLDLGGCLGRAPLVAGGPVRRANDAQVSSVDTARTAVGDITFTSASFVMGANPDISMVVGVPRTDRDRALLEELLNGTRRTAVLP